MKQFYSLAFLLLICSWANAQFQTVQNASLISGTEYQLTPQLKDQRGAIWNTQAIDLTKDFVLHTELNFGIVSETNPIAGGPPDIFRTGADGIAFVFQPNGTSTIGGYGQEIGYGGIANAFAVEFDTWQNTPAIVTGGYDHHNPAADHLAFMSEGSSTHQTANDLGTYPLGVNIEDGLWHPATFMWNATAKQLTVTFLGNTYTFTGDIAAITGTNTVNWGFTAATGLGVNDHRVRILGCQNTVIPCGNKNDKDKKVMVCHIPPGNTGNKQAICVSWSAVPAHLAHGDCLGDCSGLSAGRTAPVASELLEEAHNAAASVYPNPSRGQVQVKLGAVTSSKTQVMVINSRGITVEERTISSSSQALPLNLRKYGTGVFLVKIISGSSVQTQKVLVQE